VVEDKSTPYKKGAVAWRKLKAKRSLPGVVEGPDITKGSGVDWGAMNPVFEQKTKLEYLTRGYLFSAKEKST